MHSRFSRYPVPTARVSDQEGMALSSEVVARALTGVSAAQRVSDAGKGDRVRKRVVCAQGVLRGAGPRSPGRGPSSPGPSAPARPVTGCSWRGDDGCIPTDVECALAPGRAVL